MSKFKHSNSIENKELGRVKKRSTQSPNAITKIEWSGYSTDSTLYIPKHLQEALSLVRSISYGWDRIKFWFDDPQPNLPIKALKKECPGRVRFLLESAPFQPVWQSSLTIRQPTRRALKILRTALMDLPCSVEIGDLEICCDLITESSRKSLRLRNWLLGHLYLPYHRNKVFLERKYENVVYFHRRGNTNGNKVGKVFVIYSDRRSKIRGNTYGEQCCHLEFRLFGTEQVRRLGVQTVDDLLQFDHIVFWCREIKFGQWQSKKALGVALNGGDPLSGTGSRKKADAFLIRERYLIKKNFVLQNVLIDRRNLQSAMREIDPSVLFTRGRT